MCLALFGNGSRFQSNATHSPPRGCGVSACRSLPNHAKQAPLLESAAPGRKCGLTRISHQDAEHYVEKCLSLSSCGALYGVFRVQTVLGAPWLVFSPSARTCSLEWCSGYALRSRAHAEAENPAPSCTLEKSATPWVESRGGAPALDRGSRCCRRLSPLAGASISFLAAFPHPRSSNRTCCFPASGFQSGSCLRPRKALGP